MEMGLIPSSGRLARRCRTSTAASCARATCQTRISSRSRQDWAHERELPLYFNFASNFKLSQLRALVVEAIRQHNVGLIVVDHFRMIDPDRRVNNRTRRTRPRHDS
jgi:replicative DNA helicase